MVLCHQPLLRPQRGLISRTEAVNLAEQFARCSCIHENEAGPGVRQSEEKAIYGSINFPLVALIAASVRVAAPSLPRALSA